MATIENALNMNFTPPTNAGLPTQVLTRTGASGTIWANASGVSPNGVQIFFSKKIGSDVTGDGSYLSPYASINFAYAAAGSPTSTVFITGLDGETYDEQLVLNSSHIFINAEFAHLQYTGAGDAITVTVSGAGVPIILATIGATSGNAVVNTGNEVVVIEAVLLQGNVVNSGAGIMLIESQLVGVNINNTGSGSIYYNINARTGGTDSAGVFGISSSKATGPFSIGGYAYPFGGSTTPGYVLTATGPNTLGFAPGGGSIPANAFQIYVSALFGNDANNGSFTNPLATIGAALTLAGSPSPSAPVVIFLYDASSYNEAVVIAPSVENLFIFGPTAAINFSGTGDALTVGASAKLFINIATVTNSGAGNAITNNGGEVFGLISVIQSSTTAINNVSGAVLVETSLAIQGDILLTAGNVLYYTSLRTGTDAPGVVGINIEGTSGPWIVQGSLTASGLQYPTSSTNNYVMTDSGGGVLQMLPPQTGFTSINIQTFTPGGTYTYTPTTGMAYAIVECVGSGGGGGGAGTGAGESAAAGGGGGGAYAKSVLSSATIGGSQTVTVGAGGSGAAPGTGNGLNGASSSFGALVEADGGSGGQSGIPSASFAYGLYGAGGGSGTGQIVVNGENGALGQAFGTNLLGYGGEGGDAFYGVGGAQLINLTGAAGTGHGSGGSGGASGNTGNAGGGNGADGIVIVTEYII
jgi:hypothetical protein